MEMAIDPHYLRMECTRDSDNSAPSLLVTFVAKAQWNSWRTVSAHAICLTTKELEQEPLTHPDHDPRTLYDAFHYPGVPEIKEMNGSAKLIDEKSNPPVVRMVTLQHTVFAPLWSSRSCLRRNGCSRCRSFSASNPIVTNRASNPADTR